MPADYNVRDVFFLFTGWCGHRWVAENSWHACPTCGAREDCKDIPGYAEPMYEHVVAAEPITVNFAYILPKVRYRIKQAIRTNRRKQRQRKTAAVISLAAHRPGPPPPGP